MKNFNTIVAVLLNVLFCTLLLWFFTQNAFLRPYAGSPFKEALAGLLVIGALYANYFLLYPTLYQKHSHIIYWLALVFTALITGLMDLAIAYKNIASCNVFLIQEVGFVGYFSMHLFFIAGRNLLLNFFPFLIRERQHFQQAFEKEVKVVYQKVRMLDVTDKKSNIHLVNIDDIFYCHQQRNYTDVYMVQNMNFTRLGSMKHLEQLFGEEFIRITTTDLLPFRYIRSCKENTVIMKKMPWEKESTTFKLEPKNQEEIAEMVVEGLIRYRAKANGKSVPKKPTRPKTKRKPVTPPDKKLTAVLSYIKSHPNCNSGDIIAETNIPLSTIERCVAVLKKQGLIEHTGSRRRGGYHIVNTTQEDNVSEPAQNEGNITEEKVTEEKSAKKKLNDEKPSEPSSKE